MHRSLGKSIQNSNAIVQRLRWGHKLLDVCVDAEKKIKELSQEKNKFVYAKPPVQSEGDESPKQKVCLVNFSQG